MVDPIQSMNGNLLLAGNIFASQYCYHLYHLDDIILFFGGVSTIEGTTVLSSALGTLLEFDVLTKVKGLRQLSHSSRILIDTWATATREWTVQVWSSKQSSTRK